MKIECEAVLNKFRTPGRCELCNERCRMREPHHIMAKGMGGGKQLDVSINICNTGVAFTCQCHREHHDGNLPRDRILAVVAKRHRTDPDSLWEALCVLVRLPKESTYKTVEAELAELSKEVGRLVRMALREVGRCQPVRS